MPQTVYDVGDPITSRLKLGVVPDGTTVTSIAVTRPDGTVMGPYSPGAYAGDETSVQFYATDDGTPSGAVANSAGDWLAVWKVQGTGASVTPKVYNVAPLPGVSTRVAWSPFLSDVADHCPFLTVDTRTPGAQTWLGTFTGWTSPTDEQAQRHIDQATAIVGAGLGTLTGQLPRIARSVASLFAAASLIRAFSRGSEDLQLATALLDDARRSLTSLKEAADNAGADTLSARPVLYAPDPVPWGDDLVVGMPNRTYGRQYLWPE
jgi:hypothetical protein